MDKTTSCVVYWLHDERCVCPWRHGYIGISTRWTKRLKRHRTNRKPFLWQILFKGSLTECLHLEHQYRPQPGIGWNEAPGGEHGGGSAPKKESTRKLMQQAALHRYTKPGERERTTSAVQKAFENIDRSGANNGHFGKPCSEITKQLIRDKITERGGVTGASNPMFGKPRPQNVKDTISAKLQKSICHNGHAKEPGKPCRICARESERRYRERQKLIR